MRRVFGPRTAVEAAFLVAVPVVVFAVGGGPAVIIAGSAVAYLAVILFEAMLWRNRPQPASDATVHAGTAPVETVHVLPGAEPELEPLPQPEPQPEPEP